MVESNHAKPEADGHPARSNRLAGKLALITGASKGIGFAIARAFLAADAAVVMNARNASQLDRAAGELREEYDSDVTTFAGDVTDPVAVAEMVALACVERPVDVLVNNAGTYKARPFVEYEAQDFRDLFEVNVVGSVHVTQSVLKQMIGKRLRLYSQRSLQCRQMGFA